MPVSAGFTSFCGFFVHNATISCIFESFSHVFHRFGNNAVHDALGAAAQGGGDTLFLACHADGIDNRPHDFSVKLSVGQQTVRHAHILRHYGANLFQFLACNAKLLKQFDQLANGDSGDLFRIPMIAFKTVGVLP